MSGSKFESRNVARLRLKSIVTTDRDGRNSDKNKITKFIKPMNTKKHKISMDNIAQIDKQKPETLTRLDKKPEDELE